MNVLPTAEVIKKASETMKMYANEMDKVANKMIENDDISYASEAIQVITNMMLNVRMDLFVSRPIREITKENTQ